MPDTPPCRDAALGRCHSKIPLYQQVEVRTGIGTSDNGRKQPAFAPEDERANRVLARIVRDEPRLDPDTTPPY